MTTSQEKISRLQATFFEKLPGKIRDIKELLSEFMPVQGADTLLCLHTRVHGLVGAAGTFGAHDISLQAKQLENFINSKWLPEPSRFSENDLSYLQNGVTELERLASSLLESEFVPLPEFVPRAAKGQGQVFYLASDAKLGQDICETLQSEGFAVVMFSSSQELEQAWTKSSPQVLIIESPTSLADSTIIDQLRTLQYESLRCPVFVISEVDDIYARLAAARQNVARYFRTPIDKKALVSALNSYSSSVKLSPYRVLVVDDEVELAQYHVALLQENGFHARFVSDPLLTLRELEIFKPDLVLIDLYMQSCSGRELVSVIRQDDKYAYLPVVFLSSEQHPEQQMKAIEYGADGFLTKPIEVECLINSLLPRLKRARGINRMQSDLNASLRQEQFRRVALDQHAIVSTANVEGRITEVNEKFCEISGYSRNELIGKNHRIVNSGYHSEAFFREMWDTIAQGNIWHGEVCNRRKNGDIYWVESTIVPFLDSDGLPYQYVSVRTDITRIKAAESALRRSEERLQRSQEFANIGTWDWNIVSSELYWSPRIAPLFGYKHGEIETTYENFLRSVHPDDRQQVINAVNNCVEFGAKYDIEHRCVWPDGSVRWLVERGDVVRDEAGNPLHMLGVVQDVTERKNMERMLAQQGALLNLLRRGMSDFLVATSINEVAEYLLSGLLKLTGSQYGFTGEVLHRNDGSPYLKTHAITNIAWDDDAAKFYEKYVKQGFEFDNLDTLFGEVLRSGRTVISNDVEQDSRAGGLPNGHPPLKQFLGVPVFFGKELVGLYGLANREDGYDDEIIEFLQPFTTTYGAIIFGKRMSDDQVLTLKALEQARTEAEKANRAKSEFLSRMSHELRTPMNAILGFSQLMEMDNQNPLSDSQKDNVEEILKAGKHLLELINDVLDLSKIEAGRIDLTIEALLIKPLIEECIGLVMPLASAQGISVGMDGSSIKSPLETLSLRADRTRLKQVILNLLSNAIKYNVPNGSVTVKLSGDDKSNLLVSVVDTGIGIPKEKVGSVFTSFNRLGAEATDVEGTGIGLVICKNIIEIMGGVIGFDSEVGKGSTFWISLPQDSHDVNDFSSEQQKSAYSDETNQFEGRGCHVLYIEDNPANLRLVSQILAKRKDIYLQTAHTAELGVELARNHAFDLILMDIQLPGIEGSELLQMIRKIDTYSDVPVMAVSAKVMYSDLEDICQAGFNDYITKPMNVVEFLEKIDKLLKNRHCSEKLAD